MRGDPATQIDPLDLPKFVIRQNGGELHWLIEGRRKSGRFEIVEGKGHAGSLTARMDCFKRTEGARPSADKLAAFYAEMVNSDRFLLTNTISNTIRDAMLSSGLVTQERLRVRGVH